MESHRDRLRLVHSRFRPSGPLQDQVNIEPVAIAAAVYSSSFSLRGAGSARIIDGD